MKWSDIGCAFVAVAYVALLAVTQGCPPAPEPPHTDPNDGGEDGEDPPVESATFPICAKACATLKRLGCPEADRPDGGSTCYAVCAKAERSGKFGLRPSCVAVSKSQADVKACGSIRCLGK